MGKKGFPYKEINKIIKKIAPDLEQLQTLLDELEVDADSVIEDNIRVGTSNLLIAKRIIKERKKETLG